MPRGAITSYIDVAQLALYAFWIFFAGLVFYLRREDKREGYPLLSDRSASIRVQGFPPIPVPKRFILAHGGTRSAPRQEAPARAIAATPVGLWPGAPLHPTGNPMVDGVGAAAYADREDVPDPMFDGGLPKIVPMRVAIDFFVEPSDPDPRGMPVLGADGVVAGTISDIWVDRAEVLIRYLEVEIVSVVGPRHVLLPMPLARIAGGKVHVNTILAAQFQEVPRLQNPDQVTLREEDRISAYYGGGQLYAEPLRLESLL
jgi:photosynthetic reaction center H subunit